MHHIWTELDELTNKRSDLVYSFVASIGLILQQNCAQGLTSCSSNRPTRFGNELYGTFEKSKNLLFEKLLFTLFF